MTENYKEVFSEILSGIKTINGVKELFYGRKKKKKTMLKLPLILTMIYL